MNTTIISHAIFWTVTLLVVIGLIILFKSVLFPFVLGATIAYLLNPVVEFLSRKGMNRTSATLMILGSFVLVMGIILALSVPILLREAAGFIEAAPGYADRLWAMTQPYIDTVREKLGYRISNQIETAVQDNFGKTLGASKSVISTLVASIAVGGQALVEFIASLLLTPIVAFFMMKDWPKIVRWTYSLMPRHSEAVIRDLLGQIDVKIAGFIRGQLTVCVLLGLMYAIALTIAGLNYGFVIGLATGILCIVPFVGSTAGLLVGLIVAFLQSGDISYMAVIAAIFGVGQFIEGNFITPKLMGDKVGLHPLWIMFALLAGGSLLGLTGMFLAVPMAAIIGVLVSFAIHQYKRSPYYSAAPKLVTPDQNITVVTTTEPTP